MKKGIESIIFLLWFFGSIWLAFYFAEHKGQEYLILVVIGQIFFIMGIYALIDMIKEKKHFWTLLFPIIGLGMIIVGLGNYFHIDLITKYCIILIPIAMILFGILMLIDDLLKCVRKYENCTYKVNAKIIGTLENPNKNLSKIFTLMFTFEKKEYPVYEFNYNNQYYLVSNAKYHSIIQKEELSEIYSQEKTIELLINPEDPYTWKENESLITDLLIINILSIIIGIVLTYIFVKYLI